MSASRRVTDERPSSEAELRALIEEHLPLVRHIVFQVAANFPRHVDREELARAGALGLVEAAQRYDEARGVPFGRFVAQRIRGSILDAVRASDWAPRSVRTLARTLDSAEQTLASRLGRAPTLDEIAVDIGVPTVELQRLQDRVFRSVVLALEHVVADDDEDDMTLGEVLTDRSIPEPSEELEKRELNAYLRDAVKLLPERHRLVVTGYFLDERSSKDLARLLGVTESRVSQLRSESLEMLREGLEAQFGHSVGDDDTARISKRKRQYASAISKATDFRHRIEPAPTLA